MFVQQACGSGHRAYGSSESIPAVHRRSSILTLVSFDYRLKAFGSTVTQEGSMKKLCLIGLPVIAVFVAGTYALITEAQTTPSKIDVVRAATTMFELAAPSNYTKQARLSVTPSVGGFDNHVSINGNTAVLYSGAGVYVYTRSGELWSKQAVLVPSDGVPVMGFSRTSVAFDGDTVVIGGSAATINSNANQGAAYVFVRNDTTWSEQQRLIASDGASGDQFGLSVAINGNSIIVGASVDDVGPNKDQGSAYIFVRQGTTWTQQARLVADDGATNHFFGDVVAINGDTAVVTRGYNQAIPNRGAYVFVRSGTTWSQQQKLSVCEPSGNGGVQCNFGTSISIAGDNLAVGNSFLNVGGNLAQGGIYVFTRSGTLWSQQQRLTASDGQADDNFGNAVALEDNTIIVGSSALNVRSGAAYLFTRTLATWTQQQKFQEPSPNVSNVFGYSVSISGNTFIVATPRDQGLPGPNAIGAAYIYTPPAPVAVSVSGRVTTPFGIGLRNASVFITNSQGVRRTATTSSFGFYSFDNVLTGDTYTLGVNSKRYRFQPQTLPVNNDLPNVDFVGLE